MNDDEPDDNHIEVNTSPTVGAYAHFPPWLVIHVPHDSTVIPSGVRSQFLLTDEELRIPRDGERGFHGNVNGDSRAW